MGSRKEFLSICALGGLAYPFAKTGNRNESGVNDRQSSSIFNVTDFGAKGDGESFSSDAFQLAIDAAESAGGGKVLVPSGTFILEKTPLIATGVHLQGMGPSTVLRGHRPGNERGAALISNKGQHAPGYDGAHSWSITDLAIDSPHTNGIVVTHAKDVFISGIYGIDAWHHFIDTAGLNILCEKLFLTGRSGTSTFQIDSLSSAQTIWDGQQAVAPLRDGTDTKKLILRNSIITATAGHTGDGDQHDVSIHFHGDDTSDFVFSDLILGGARYGFYQDPGTRYQDMLISNVLSRNPDSAIWLGHGLTEQKGLIIRGLIHDPDPVQELQRERGSIYFYGKNDVQISDVQCHGIKNGVTKYGIKFQASEKVMINNSIFKSESSGTAVKISDQLNQEDTRCKHVNLHGCFIDGYENGITFDNRNNGSEVWERMNSYINVQNRKSGKVNS